MRCYHGSAGANDASPCPAQTQRIGTRGKKRNVVYDSKSREDNGCDWKRCIFCCVFTLPGMNDCDNCKCRHNQVLTKLFVFCYFGVVVVGVFLPNVSDDSQGFAIDLPLKKESQQWQLWTFACASQFESWQRETLVYAKVVEHIAYQYDYDFKSVFVVQKYDRRWA